MTEITVPSYEKRGDGLRNTYIVYKIVFKPKDIPIYKQSQYEVVRRFSDFLGLYQKLASKHLAKGLIVPLPPEKSIVGNARTKMAKDEESYPAEFLEGRRQQLERYLRRLAQHPVVLTDCDFVDFVTLNVDLPKASNTSTLSMANINRLVSRVGDALSKMSVQINENDQWFETKMIVIDDLHDAVAKVISAADATVHSRREMALSLTSLSASIALLASCEENKPLARALGQMAGTQEKVALCYKEQAGKDLYLMAECWRDQLHMLDAVKAAFNERQKIYQQWQAAQVTLTKKREKKARLELQGQSDRLPTARAECQDQAMRVANIEVEFERMSKMLKAELERWDAQRVNELKSSLMQYIEILTHAQQQMTKHWETYAQEAKEILG